MKHLVIGDPHVCVEEIDDSAALKGFVLGKLDLLNEAVRVVITGDLFHNHALLHVDVLVWWKEALQQLLSHPQVKDVVLVLGNHDGPHDISSGRHALIALRGDPRLHIADHPMILEGIGYLPFYRTNDEFRVGVQQLQLQGVKTVYCHQEFSGAQFENGMYAPNGFDSKEFPAIQFISGHIHKIQSFGNVYYVGAPRWRTMSDCQDRRGVWFIDHADSDGAVTTAEFMDTDSVCSRIIQVYDQEWSTSLVPPPQTLPHWRVHVICEGTASWCEERARMWRERGVASLTLKPTTVRENSIRESEGIFPAFGKYIEARAKTLGDYAEPLQRLFAERLGHERTV